MKEWFIVGMVIFAGGWLVWWGDNHGSSARQLAEIRRQAAATEARVDGFTTADEKSAAEIDKLRAEGYDKAIADLASSEKCVATPAMVRAFSRITQ